MIAGKTRKSVIYLNAHNFTLHKKVPLGNKGLKPKKFSFSTFQRDAKQKIISNALPPFKHFLFEQKLVT